MGLVSASSIKGLLICPRCGAPLADELENTGSFRCSDQDCRYGASGSFPLVDRWPVIVDFDRSVLSAEAVAQASTVRAGLTRARIDALPRSLRRIWKPLNRVAEGNVARLLALLPHRPVRVLVVGGGTLGNGLSSLYMTGDDVELIGLDLYGSELTQLVADAHAIPLATGCVDAVVVQAVLEHVLVPHGVVAEIHRVLTEGGLVYAETPFMQQVHAGAYDFTRFTASGHRYLFRGFAEIDSGVTAGPGTALLWSLEHLVRGLTRSRNAGRVVRALLFWLRSLDGRVGTGCSRDGASAVFFLGRRADTEMTPSEIVSYHRGAPRS